MLQLSKLKYAFSQAKKNMARNGLMTVASLFTIFCCLLILGLCTVLTFNVNHLSEKLKDQCEIQAFINEGTSEERVSAIGDEILALPNVKEILLFTSEDTLNFVRDDMFEGNEALVESFKDDNPFRDSYKITLEDISLTASTVAEIEGLADINHVENKQDAVNTIISMSAGIKKASIVIILLLLAVSMVIISNTVRLTVFNRRKEINIMKYIGATDRFIRIPFIIEGILIGFFGALAAFGTVSWGYVFFSGMLAKSTLAELAELLPYSGIAPIIGAMLAAVGCLIGVVGSVISMRKYLDV